MNWGTPTYHSLTKHLSLEELLTRRNSVGHLCQNERLQASALQVLEQSGYHKDYCWILHQQLELSNYSFQHHSRWQNRQKLHQEIHSLRRKGFCPCMSCWRRLCGCPEILAMTFFHHSNHLQFSPSNVHGNYIMSNENSSKTTVVSQSSLSFLVKQWLVEKSLSCSVRQLVQGSVPLIPCHVQGGY